MGAAVPYSLGEKFIIDSPTSAQNIKKGRRSDAGPGSGRLPSCSLQS